MHCLRHRPNARADAAARSASLFPLRCSTTCTVIWPFAAIDMNRWSTISALKSPMNSSLNTSPLAKNGLLLRSITTSTIAASVESLSTPSSTPAAARPMRLHPALSPSDSLRTCPTVMATSSVVWWSSIQRSPVASTLSCTPPSCAMDPRSSSRVCMPVETDDFPAAPSRSSLTSMVVSLVLLALPAARVTPSRRSSEAATSIPSTWSMHLRRHRAKDLNVASTM
mmetsp:Transcript_10236/g.46660  ORF Transcript_10236/g.46660 Transcript_10236/m.46660 type:complete len:225 (-) Transcript_10236:772-1446(-)